VSPRWRLHLKFRVIDEVIYLGQILLEICFLGLVNKLKQLKVKDGLVSVLLVVEEFDGAVRVDQIVLEEGGILFCLSENVSEGGRLALDIFLKLAVFSLVFAQGSFHSSILDIEI